MSLKGDKYETAEETKFRLESTVVLYDKRPVYISQVGAPGIGEEKEIARVHFYNLPLLARGENKVTRKYLSSRHFDLAPFSMGYMNHGGQAIFVGRAPVRQQRQGLSAGTATFTGVDGQHVMAFNFDQMIKAQGFIDMFDGKYPSFAEAGEKLGDAKMASVAISRMFAFVIDNDLEALYLLHKGIRCGLALKNDKALKVPPKYHFLREEMEECRIPLG